MNAETPANPPLPDRLNEDWRYGKPHQFAAELAAIMGTEACGELTTDAPVECVQRNLSDSDAGANLPSIGSGYFVREACARCSGALRITLPAGEWGTAESPLRICCRAGSFYAPRIIVELLPGARAHISEEHFHEGKSTLLCLRSYTVHPNAELHVEMRENGSGVSRAMDISHISCLGNARVRQLTAFSHHAWAREETTADLWGRGADLLLLSANCPEAEQWLDQRCLQLHHAPGAKSRSLYKNVLRDAATAIFGGSIRVLPGAHESDAYLSNLNLMLSPKATIHSLPGLEIMADRVRCSHGSACSPPDAEQLFYLRSRGLPADEARRIIAEGFLQDVLSLFAES